MKPIFIKVLFIYQKKKLFCTDIIKKLNPEKKNFFKCVSLSGQCNQTVSQSSAFEYRSQIRVRLKSYVRKPIQCKTKTKSIMTLTEHYWTDRDSG